MSTDHSLLSTRMSFFKRHLPQQSPPHLSTGTGTEPAICIATILNPASAGGIQTHFHMFQSHVEAHGGRVPILSPFVLPKSVIYPAVALTRFGKFVNSAVGVWWREMSYFLLLHQLLRRRLPKNSRTILYAQDALAARAAISLKREGYPVEVVYVVHFNVSPAEEWVGRNEIKRGGWLYRNSERITLEAVSQCDRLIIPSQFMVEQVRKRYPESARVATWRMANFVVPVTDQPLPGISGDIITIGSLEPRKNQFFLLDVLLAARELGHRYRLTIAGDGPSRADLEKRVDEEGLEDQVTFLGFVPRAARLLPAHRVYTHAAKMENLPISLIEALSAGKPVLAAPSGGIPEVYSDGIEGIYWNLNDPESAARHLIRVLEDPALYSEMSRAALARYEACFSADAVGAQLYDAVRGASLPNVDGEGKRIAADHPLPGRSMPSLDLL